MQQVEYIACSNGAAFVMNFSIRWLNEGGYWQTSDWNSGDYPVHQTRTSPSLSSLGVPPDALAVTPHVNAILGTSNDGAPYVLSADNGQVATYDVTGTTLIFSVKLK